MKVLLFLTISFLVHNVNAQSDTSVAKKHSSAHDSAENLPAFYPRIASYNLKNIFFDKAPSKVNTSSRTFLYWDPNAQMLLRKPYTSQYKDPKLLNTAQGILSFVIPNNVAKP